MASKPRGYSSGGRYRGCHPPSGALGCADWWMSWGRRWLANRAGGSSGCVAWILVAKFRTPEDGIGVELAGMNICAVPPVYRRWNMYVCTVRRQRLGAY
jgi:hypothetical protein